MPLPIWPAPMMPTELIAVSDGAAAMMTLSLLPKRVRAFSVTDAHSRVQRLASFLASSASSAGTI
jgi:hypothetical protein